MNPAFTVKVYGVYMLIMGIGLFLVPNVLFSLLSLPSTHEVWIRILGLLSLVVSLYYFNAASSHLEPFFKISVIGRLIFVVGLVGLFINKLAPMTILIFALVEFLGAIWTLWSLKRS